MSLTTPAEEQDRGRIMTRSGLFWFTIQRLQIGFLCRLSRLINRREDMPDVGPTLGFLWILLACIQDRSFHSHNQFSG